MPLQNFQLYIPIATTIYGRFSKNNITQSVS